MPNYLSMDPNAGSDGGAELEFDRSDISSGVSSTAKPEFSTMTTRRSQNPSAWELIEAANFPTPHDVAPEMSPMQAGALAAGALPMAMAIPAAPQVAALAATPVGGGVIGAIPGITKGDPWQAAKGAAIGAATGGVGGNLGKILPFLMRLRTGANVAKAAPAVVEAAEAAAPVAAATRAAGREAFEAQSAELAKMLGQPPSGAAPAVWNTVSSQATQIANKLRQVAETSATNKKLVMDAIKSDFEAAGFPTWQAFRDFVFQARTRMP